MFARRMGAGAAALSSGLSRRRRARVERLETRALLVTTLAELATVGGRLTGRLESGQATSDFPAVGLVGDSGGFFCSGTLIDATHVLTAGHCADGVADASGRFAVGGRTYSTRDVTVHPNYNRSRIGTDAANDLAIFELTQAVTNVAPSPLFEGTPRVGDTLTLVGYGAGASGGTSHNGSFGVKRFGTTPIDSVSTRLISWRLDHLRESNTAPGDSGGPAYLNVAGVYYVAGVTSGGTQSNAGYGDLSFDTRVDAYASWIESVAGSAGTSLNPAPTPARDDHPNAISATVAAIPISAGSGQVSATLEQAGDRDFFRFSLAQAGQVTIRQQAAAAGLDTYLRVYSASGQLLAANDDSGGSTNSLLTLALAGGTYYVSAGAYQDAGAGRYTLGVSVATDDYGQTRADAGLLSVDGAGNGGARGTIGFAGDRDALRLVAPRSGALTLTLRSSGGGLDPMLAVYDSLGRPLASNDDAIGTDSRLSLAVTAGRTYYVVASGYGSTTGSYQLSVAGAATRSLRAALADAALESMTFRARFRGRA